MHFLSFYFRESILASVYYITNTHCCCVNGACLFQQGSIYVQPVPSQTKVQASQTHRAFMLHSLHFLLVYFGFSPWRGSGHIFYVVKKYIFLLKRFLEHLFPLIYFFSILLTLKMVPLQWRLQKTFIWVARQGPMSIKGWPKTDRLQKHIRTYL